MTINYDNPLISVIIPFYNREADTMNALKSVLEQTYANWELILVNDGSEDNIDNLTRVLNECPKARMIHIPQCGVATARNQGLANSNGEFIAFLDSDDTFEHTKLEWQLAAMRRSGALFSHTSYREQQKDGNISRIVRAGRFTGKVFPGIISQCPIATPTVMVHRSLSEIKDFFPTAFHIGEDVCAWITLTSKHDIIGIDIPLSVVNVSPNSAISRPEKQIEGLRNIIHFVENHPDLPGRCYKQLSELYANVSVNFRILAGENINELGHLKALAKNRVAYRSLMLLDSALRGLVQIKHKIIKK